MSLVLKDQREHDDVTSMADYLSSCCGDGGRSVADRRQPCQWYDQCRGRWWTQALSTRKSSDRLYIQLIAIVLISSSGDVYDLTVHSV